MLKLRKKPASLTDAFIFLILFFILSQLSFASNIPLLKVATKDREHIPQNKRKIRGQFLLIEQPQKKDFSECESASLLAKRKGAKPIQIKVRGNITRFFPKKGLQVEFTDPKDNDESIDVPLLGMEKAPEWNLIASYMDRSLMRNVLTFDLARQFKNDQGEPLWYTPQYQYVELMVNCQYRGIYTLVEKIERAKNKVKLEDFDWNHPEKSPFILKKDGKGFGHVSEKGETFRTTWGSKLSFFYPSKKKILKLKEERPDKFKEFIKTLTSSLDSVEDLLFSITAKEQKTKEIENLIDLPSFAHFMIVQEMTKNIDGYRRSLYFYRDDHGKYRMGPVWDFDTALGNLWFYRQHLTWGFQYGHVGRYLDGNVELFWFKRLMNNKKFATLVVDTYKKLRAKGQPLHWDSIEGTIDNMLAHLPPEAIERNFDRWKVLGKRPKLIFFIPPPYPHTHAGEVLKLKKWFKKRLEWLDVNFPDRLEAIEKYVDRADGDGDESEDLDDTDIVPDFRDKIRVDDLPLIGEETETDSSTEEDAEKPADK